jgi:hypothetical protein
VFRLTARNHDSATVDGIVHSTDPVASLESVEHGRDGAGCQPNSLREFASSHRPQPADQIHTLGIGTVHPQAVGYSLVHQIELAVQGPDLLEGLLDQSLFRIAV